MKTVTLKDIATIQSGAFLSTIKDGNTFYLQAKNFDNFGDLKENLVKDLEINDIPQRYLLQDKDILLVAKGTRNFAAIYNSNFGSSVASSTFFVIRLKHNANIIPEYLAIMLNHSQNQNYFKNNFSGSSIPSIPKSVLENFKFNIPTLEKQQAIIELNTLYKKEIGIRQRLIEKKELLINKIIFKSSNI